MILEAAFGYSIWQMVKANSIDEKTLKTLEKAHMTDQDALASFDQHKMCIRDSPMTRGEALPLFFIVPATT